MHFICFGHISNLTKNIHIVLQVEHSKDFMTIPQDIRPDFSWGLLPPFDDFFEMIFDFLASKTAGNGK